MTYGSSVRSGAPVNCHSRRSLLAALLASTSSLALNTSDALAGCFSTNFGRAALGAAKITGGVLMILTPEFSGVTKFAGVALVIAGAADAIPGTVGLAKCAWNAVAQWL